MDAEFENHELSGGGSPRESGPCAAIRELFVPYLDGESTAGEAAAVEEHVAWCAACARDLGLEREIGAALRDTARRGEVLPRDLAERVRAAAQRPATSWWSGKWALRAAAAAVILGCAGLAFRALRAPPEGAGGGAGLEVAEQVLQDLDLLETLDQEGLDPSLELVRALLAPAGEAPESAGGEVLDPSVFDYLLEEEI